MSEQQKFPTDEELKQTGRNFAIDLLRQVVEASKVPEQLNGQLHLLNCTAVHLIATNIFNRSKHSGESHATLIMEQKDLIEDELNAILAHKDDLETIGNEKADQ